MEIPQENKKSLFVSLIVLVVVLCVYFGVKTYSEFRSYNSINEGTTMSFSGHGEVNATPDIATVSFSITKEGKTVKEAQDEVAKTEASVLESLKKDGVEKKDIKTLNVSFNPKYEYKYKNMVCAYPGCPTNPIIIGYQAFENLEVKIRKIDDAGKVIQNIGSLGVSDLNGPNFTVDKEDVLKAEARKKAIEDAESKAKILAKDLGVKLGKIISFNEGNSPMPMFDQSFGLESSKAVAGRAFAPAELPKGENTISSDVTITYQIK